MPRGYAVPASTELNQILSRMNEEGRFPISVLADAQGLAIASAVHGDLDADRQSAVVGLIQQTATRVSRQLGMATTDEMSIFDNDGQRLVCRPLRIGDHALVLALMVPERSQSYRQLTNRAMAEIRRVWTRHWD